MTRTVRSVLSVASLALGACTLASGVSDYEVDPSSTARDLDYQFVGMIAHASNALDVAIVDENNQLQARARVILPPPAANFPTERLTMKNALTPGAQTLYFFADNNGNGLVDGSKNRIVEHIWIEPVPDNGVGEFIHNTNFDYFTDDAYTSLTGAFVLELPAAFRSNDPVLLACLEDKLGKQVDVTLTLIEQERQVGLFRRYRGTPPPMEVRLRGVLDGGSMYRIEVLVDGESKKKFEKMAPANDDLAVPASEWFPASLEDVLRDCR